MPASRLVTKAVSDVLDLARRDGEVSLTRLVAAVSEQRSRPIEITTDDLPPGVCGQWRQYSDHDVFLIQRGLPTWDRTLAHELGHLVLGHDGMLAEALAALLTYRRGRRRAGRSSIVQVRLGEAFG